MLGSKFKNDFNNQFYFEYTKVTMASPDHTIHERPVKDHTIHESTVKDYAIAAVPGLYYIPDAITEDQETELLAYFHGQYEEKCSHIEIANGVVLSMELPPLLILLIK